MNPPVATCQSLGALRDTTTDNKAEFFHSLHDPVFKSLRSAIKEAIFGESLLVYLETIRQVAKIDHTHGQIQYMLQYLHALSLPEPFFLLLTFLVGNGSRTVLEIFRFLLVLT